MALTRCRKCGKQVSAEATACPHCGCPQPADSPSQLGTRSAADSASRPPGAPSPSEGGISISARELDRRRTVYYVLYFCGIPLALAARVTEAPLPGLVLSGLCLAWLVAFLWVFLKAARLAGLSVAALVPISVLLLIPILGIVTLMVVDFRIADTVARELAQGARPRLSRLSYWSLLMAWLPIVGLPMAAVALWQIGASRGMLRGRGLAIGGLILNALALVGFLALVLGAASAPSAP
jgi:hypothetical protein